MTRDTRTEAIFTTADDQMQGLWGFHCYVKAATDIVEPDALLNQLPHKAFRLTHEWVRYYDPKEMAVAVSQMHEVLLCRQSLLTLVAVGEAALLRLNEHLVKTKGVDKVSKNKKLLEWAFSLVRKSSMASREATARLPITCGDLDNARRLRNCIVHSNSRYDPAYLATTIQNGWVAPQYENDSQAAVKEGRPIFLGTARFEYFLHSHLEFLHILHNTIQRQQFGHLDGYHYGNEGKPIEWYRILSGRSDVNM